MWDRSGRAAEGGGGVQGSGFREGIRIPSDKLPMGLDFGVRFCFTAPEVNTPPRKSCHTDSKVIAASTKGQRTS